MHQILNQKEPNGLFVYILKSGMESSMHIDTNRADWIGHDRLWPLHTLLNAGDWTPQMNRQYQAAFDIQERAIKQARELETQSDYEKRILWCDTTKPETAQDVFDKFLPIAKLEADIKFQEGLIQGLQICRDRAESMLEIALKEVVGLRKLHKERIEAYWNECPGHLIRQGRHVFVKGMPQYEEEYKCNENPKKRHIDEVFWKQLVLPETPEYWLKDNHLTWGIDCISH